MDACRHVLARVRPVAGLGAGQAWGKTRVYIAGGTKRFRVCVNDGRPAHVRTEPAGQLLVLREFELRK